MRPIGWDVGDQALLEGDLLGLSWASTDIHEEAVDLQHPDYRAVVHAARERPVVIELADFQQRADRLGLPLAGALADPERLVDGRQLQVRLAAPVVEEVDPADRADDPAGPGLGLAAGQRRRSFAGQHPGELA